MEPITSLGSLKEQESLYEIRLILRTIAGHMATPLFLLFWLADIIYVPQFKWHFLALRCTIIPLNFFVTRAMNRVNRYESAQWIAFFYAASNASMINAMIFLIGDPSTSYYAGLNLVAIGALSFIPFTHQMLAHTCAAIFGPYFLIVGMRFRDASDLRQLALNAFFIVGTVVISMVVRFFNSRLRSGEIHAREKLSQELLSRESVIKEKTSEALRLHTLSAQFSPQIVRAIRDGAINIEQGVHRAEICAVFIDIVNSTDRVVRLDRESVDKVLDRFMDTVVSAFLTYDLTIDKFHGDGILAFSNDPMTHPDFVQRTCIATIEVFEKLKLDRDFYVRNWKQEMQVRAGISVGYANVGFYGNKRLYRAYTAIGRPLPLAARLTSLAEPNQILLDHDVASKLGESNFDLKQIGERSIRGFDEDRFIIYQLCGVAEEQPTRDVAEAGASYCPHCANSVLYIDTNDDGIFVMKCHQCDYVAEGQLGTPAPQAA